jgi:hypothetical protein
VLYRAQLLVALQLELRACDEIGARSLLDRADGGLELRLRRLQLGLGLCSTCSASTSDSFKAPRKSRYACRISCSRSI